MTRVRAPYHPLAGLLSLLAALALLVGLAAPAWADDQDEIHDAIENLSGASTLYVGDGSVAIDRGTVSGSLNPNRKIAVLDVSDADSAAVQIAQVLDIELVAVASREYIGVGYRNGVFCGDYPVQASEDAVSEHQSDWDDGDLTSVLSAFASKMAAAPKPGSSACSDYLANGGTGSTASERDGGGGGWIVLLVLLGIVAALVIAFVLYSRKSKAKSATVAKDKVMPYYTRLAQEILGFDTKDSDDALQAIADASAKYSTATEQIEAAQTVEDWAAARVTVLEGLNASRLARLAVGGEEGEPIPAIAEPAPDQLSAPQQVQVQGETFQGFPQYTPGSSYYYGGGSGVPGGWYSTPFWERLLIGGMFGGMSGGGGFTGAGTGRSSTPDRSAPSRRRGSSSGRGGWSSGGRGGSSSRGRSGGGRRSGGGGWSSGGRG